MQHVKVPKKALIAAAEGTPPETVSLEDFQGRHTVQKVSFHKFTLEERETLISTN